MAGIVPELNVGPKLGNGHFGEVFLGEDGVHGQVAVKVLARKPEHQDNEWLAYKAGFLGEAQKLSKARHRNVVQVFHIEELPDGNSIRFCMAFCPGGSLQSSFDTGPMPLLQVRKIATEVSLGLEALHSRGMLHRWENAAFCTPNCIDSEHPIAAHLNTSFIRSEQRLHDLYTCHGRFWLKRESRSLVTGFGIASSRWRQSFLPLRLRIDSPLSGNMCAR